MIICISIIIHLSILDRVRERERNEEKQKGRERKSEGETYVNKMQTQKSEMKRRPKTERKKEEKERITKQNRKEERTQNNKEMKIENMQYQIQQIEQVDRKYKGRSRIENKTNKKKYIYIATRYVIGEGDSGCEYNVKLSKS